MICWCSQRCLPSKSTLVTLQLASSHVSALDMRYLRDFIVFERRKLRRIGMIVRRCAQRACCGIDPYQDKRINFRDQADAEEVDDLGKTQISRVQLRLSMGLRRGRDYRDDSGCNSKQSGEAHACNVLASRSRRTEG